MDPMLQSLVDVACSPVVVASAILVGSSALASWLQGRKSAQAQRFGHLIALGGGVAYKFLSQQSAAATPLSAVALEQWAISQGVQALRGAATAEAGKLPSDAVLAVHVAGALGSLYAADPNVSVVAPALPKAPVVPAPFDRLNGDTSVVTVPVGGIVVPLTSSTILAPSPPPPATFTSGSAH